MRRPFPPFDPALLGGLSREAFLARHWHRKPLLVRAAVHTPTALPDRDALFALAASDDVESRLIARSAHGTRGRWSLEHGPFDRMPRAKRDWTLLVQGVNLVDDAADALMRRFDFVSLARLDDCMISYATDGGGVGAHVDSYDVFLLQLGGRRRWRWSERTPAEPVLVDDVPLRLLANFDPDHDEVLEPGDMLYLPPHCAHEGTAIGECTTASIGFRAPDWRELTQAFLLELADRDWPDGRYADRGRAPTATPAAIDDTLVDAVGERIARVRWTRDDVARFIGRHFSEPKQHVVFDAPRPRTPRAFAHDAGRRGLIVDRRATLLYRGDTAFMVGEHATIPRATRDAVKRLADDRRLDASDCAQVLADPDTLTLLHDWWSNGWMHLDRARR